MARTKYHKVETDNDQYLVVGVNDFGKVTIQVGYYEAELKNDQVDNLVKALKEAKSNK